MGYCWFCTHGWPKAIRDIYDEHIKVAGYSAMHFGPAHVVWEDENFDSAQWCLDNFDEYSGDHSAEELAAVRASLVALLALPANVINPRPDFEESRGVRCRRRQLPAGGRAPQ